MATPRKHIFQTLVVLAITIRVAHTFIVNKPCPVEAPCRCYGSDHLSCGAKHLTTMPLFKTSPYVNEDTFSIFLNSNYFTTLHNNSFRHLIISRTTKVNIYLNKNRLVHIETNAFAGIADRIRFLQLDRNNLSTIPSAIDKLINLESLYLRYNPISGLDARSMTSLGMHLRELYISLQRFASWPSDIDVLKSLTALHVSDLGFSEINDSLSAFHDRLQTFSIVNCDLDHLPDFVFDLPNLRSLKFSSCYNYNYNETILDPCIEPVHSQGININGSLFQSCDMNNSMVTQVDLTYNQLAYFPDVFGHFPSLTNLNLANNNVSFIHSNTIPNTNSLTYLDLGYNKFLRIPSAVNKLRFLEIMSIRNNLVSSIEEFDLFALASLKELNLAVNPLSYISEKAFENNKMLTKLDLRGTRINIIPSSVSGLHYLDRFYLPSREIRCTCALSGLRSWDVRRIDISGYCESSSTSIKSFIISELKRC